MLFWKGLVKVVVAVFLMGLLVAGSTSPSAVAQDGTWTIERVTTLSGDSWMIDADIDTNHVIHMTWQDSNPGQYEVYYNYRSPSGYGTPFQVSDTYTGPNRNLWWPRIAVSPDGAAVVVWSENRGGTYGQSIYFRYRGSDGSWQYPFRYHSEGIPVGPDVAMNSLGQFAIAWYDAESTAVYVNGEHVGGGGLLYFEAGMWPRIVYDPDDNLHLVYQAVEWYELGDIYGWKIVYRYRPSGGQWGPKMRIAGGGPVPDGINAMFTDIAIGPDNHPYIIYRQEGPPIGLQPTNVNELYCTIVRGLTLETFQVDGYGEYSIAFPIFPSIKVARVSGNIYMTWSHVVPGTGAWSVYYREVVDGILYDTQRALESNIEKPVIVLDEFYTFPIGWFEVGYIIYEDYSLGGNDGEIYLMYRDLPVIPEFPPSLVLPLLMLSALSVAILAKAKRRRNRA